MSACPQSAPLLRPRPATAPPSGLLERSLVSAIDVRGGGGCARSALPASMRQRSLKSEAWRLRNAAPPSMPVLLRRAKDRSPPARFYGDDIALQDDAAMLTLRSHVACLNFINSAWLLTVPPLWPNPPQRRRHPRCVHAGSRTSSASRVVPPWRHSPLAPARLLLHPPLASLRPARHATCCFAAATRLCSLARCLASPLRLRLVPLCSLCHSPPARRLEREEGEKG